MTPEELNRTIEVIIKSQARLAIAQEQDRERRFEVQSLTVQVVELTAHQSRRLDRQDAFYRDSLKQTGEFQSKSLQLQNETLQLQNETLRLLHEALQLLHQAIRLLHLILDRLPPQATS